MKPKIADKRGNRGKLKKIRHWLVKNWDKSLTIMISLIALIVAVHANCISSRSNAITYGLSKVDLRPIIELHTLFKSIGNIGPHFTLTNVGPVEAQQIEIKMYSHRFSEKTETVHISVSGSENDVLIGELNPQETKGFNFSDGWLNTNARVALPPQNNIMELRITYRRPQDLKEYVESAYYFVDPAGMWVTEASSSLDTDLYKTMKRALFDMTSEKENPIYHDWGGDMLHPVDLKK
jgi:hypothetical protein